MPSDRVIADYIAELLGTAPDLTAAQMRRVASALPARDAPKRRYRRLKAS